MKFLVEEHKSFQVAITKATRELQEFSFVKTRGKLHVKHKAAAKDFIFYRKKETALGDDLKWKESVSYFLFTPKKSAPYEEWNEIVKAFEKWLSLLK